MSKSSFTAWDVDDVDTIFDVEYETVSTCPSCCQTLEPNTLDVYHVAKKPGSPSQDQTHQVYVLCLCPKCRAIFMCKYTALSRPDQEDLLDCTTLDEIIPPPKAVLSFPDSIRRISSEFPTLFSQSQEAEDHHLNRIATLGYRVSLDILVKDYLTPKFPEESDAIEAEDLGQSMRRLQDPRFHALADLVEQNFRAVDAYLFKSVILTLLRYIESESAFENSLSINISLLTPHSSGS